MQRHARLGSGHFIKPNNAPTQQSSAADFLLSLRGSSTRTSNGRPLPSRKRNSSPNSSGQKYFYSNRNKTHSGIDLNNDGTISLDESIQASLKAHADGKTSMAVSSKINAAIALIDTDNSGDFSIDEILDTVAKPNHGLSDSLMQNLARYGASNGTTALQALNDFSNLTTRESNSSNPSISRERAIAAITNAKDHQRATGKANNLSSVRTIVSKFYQGEDLDFIIGFGTDRVQDIELIQNTSNPYPILNFNQLFDATQYAIEFTDSSNHTNQVIIDKDSIPLSLEHITKLKAGETYNINVYGINADGNLSLGLSKIFELTLSEQAIFDGLDGNENISDFKQSHSNDSGTLHFGPEQISWKALPAASSYKVTLVNSNHKPQQTLIETKNTQDNFIDLSEVDFGEGGNYQLQVTAIDAYGQETKTSNYDFTVNTFNAAATTSGIDIEHDSNLNSVNNVSWDSVIGAKNYTFNLKDSYGKIIFNQVLVEGQTSINFDDYYLDNDNSRKLSTLEDGNYSFSIQAHSYLDEDGAETNPQALSISGYNDLAKIADNAILWNPQTNSNTLDWAALDWAANYKIQIYDDSGSQLLKELAIPTTPNPNFDLSLLRSTAYGESLTAGDYQIRIAGVDSDGDSSIYSNLISVTI